MHIMDDRLTGAKLILTGKRSLILESLGHYKSAILR
jgi:hypothetical protein